MYVFVKEVLKWRKEFSAELNQDGFSPLHIASATGNIEIVKELLKVGHNLCRLKGKEDRIPLHYAAMNVIKGLLSANANSIEDSTARGDTALHLAVKNHQFEAFKTLLDHIKQFKKADALNKRDGQGKTILHLSALRKQYESRMHFLFFTVGFPLQLELQVSLVALIGTYDTSMVAIGPVSGISLLFTILSLLMPFGVPFATKMIRDHFRIPRYVLARTN